MSIQPTKNIYRPDGFELWRGPSALNGEPIGVVVTHLSRPPMNRKLGDMAQVWILPLDTPPNDAVRDGSDASVCGDCRFRPRNEGGCFVPVFSTSHRVWWAWRKFGSYLPETIEDAVSARGLGSKGVRIGAWGDPGAVPLSVWRPFVDVFSDWTSYTHQWRSMNPLLWGWNMASVDSDAEAAEAQARGWRTYRARAVGEPLLRTEIGCPAADESTRTNGFATCESCGLCRGLKMEGGSRADRQVKSISLFVHGHKRKRATRAVEAAGRTEVSIEAK